MTIQLAVKTMRAIQLQLEEDQGAAFRISQGKILPHMKDAYRGEDEGFRSHLGASIIGKPCARQIWYGFRWMRKSKLAARIIRLFNRGHLEEARFLAMFTAIGCKVYQHDENGNQYRISAFGGHFGGSGDGVVIGIPDVPINTPCLCEFKTHGDNSFKKLVAKGVREEKFEHYIQMQLYMRKMHINYCIYCAVNKNDDDIYMEIITLEGGLADDYQERAGKIIFMRTVPDRIPNASKGFYQCRFCNDKDLCFGDDEPAHNCRTCNNAVPQENGTWECWSTPRSVTVPNTVLSKEMQLTGCKDFYVPIV